MCIEYYVYKLVVLICIDKSAVMTRCLFKCMKTAKLAERQSMAKPKPPTFARYAASSV